MQTKGYQKGVGSKLENCFSHVHIFYDLHRLVHEKEEDEVEGRVTEGIV